MRAVMSRVAYEIRVAGEVPPGLLDDFQRITISVDRVGTTMVADLTDEAELHGILDALRRGGLVLIDVRREQIPEPPGDLDATGDT
jgi:hypothetical protein